MIAVHFRQSYLPSPAGVSAWSLRAPFDEENRGRRRQTQSSSWVGKRNLVHREFQCEESRQCGSDNVATENFQGFSSRRAGSAARARRWLFSFSNAQWRRRDRACPARARRGKTRRNNESNKITSVAVGIIKQCSLLDGRCRELGTDRVVDRGSNLDRGYVVRIIQVSGWGSH